MLKKIIRTLTTLFKKTTPPAPKKVTKKPEEVKEEFYQFVESKPRGRKKAITGKPGEPIKKKSKKVN